jgi:hypothetical protein
VILMGIVTRRRKDEVCRAIVSHVLQNVLDAIPDRREASLGQLVEFNSQFTPGNEGGSGLLCFGVTFVGSRQDNVSNPQARLEVGQSEQGPTGSDLNIVRMRADCQDRQRPLRGRLDLEGKHGANQVWAETEKP